MSNLKGSLEILDLALETLNVELMKVAPEDVLDFNHLRKHTINTCTFFDDFDEELSKFVRGKAIQTFNEFFKDKYEDFERIDVEGPKTEDVAKLLLKISIEDLKSYIKMKNGESVEGESSPKVEYSYKEDVTTVNVLKGEVPEIRIIERDSDNLSESLGISKERLEVLADKAGKLLNENEKLCDAIHKASTNEDILHINEYTYIIMLIGKHS